MLSIRISQFALLPSKEEEKQQIDLFEKKKICQWKRKYDRYASWVCQPACNDIITRIHNWIQGVNKTSK